MNFKIINLLVLILLLFASLLLVETTLADYSATKQVVDGLQVTSDQAGVTPAEGSGTIQAMRGKMINYLFGVVAIVFLTVILIGGYLWMSASGNEEGIKKAKAFILNGIFGLVVIFIAYGLVSLILWALDTATTGSYPL